MGPIFQLKVSLRESKSVRFPWILFFLQLVWHRIGVEKFLCGAHKFRFPWESFHMGLINSVFPQVYSPLREKTGWNKKCRPKRGPYAFSPLLQNNIRTHFWRKPCSPHKTVFSIPIFGQTNSHLAKHVLKMKFHLMACLVNKKEQKAERRRAGIWHVVRFLSVSQPLCFETEERKKEGPRQIFFVVPMQSLIFTTLVQTNSSAGKH